VAGGVAANLYLRGKIEDVCKAKGYQLFCPPLRLCTDNAAMIAWAGYEQYLAGNRTGYDFEPRARWPLYL
jgi:N6-L-threonylcarbamoyladenine synthase